MKPPFTGAAAAASPSVSNPVKELLYTQRLFSWWYIHLRHGHIGSSVGCTTSSAAGVADTLNLCTRSEKLLPGETTRQSHSKFLIDGAHILAEQDRASDCQDV